MDNTTYTAIRQMVNRLAATSLAALFNELRNFKRKMPRTKERKKFLHQPSTHEILNCLASMPKWSTVLLEHGAPKAYNPFLKWLLEKNFFADQEEKIAIKKIAADFKTETPKATKWLHEIYEDLLELNFDQPELFTNNKLLVTFYFHYFDNHFTVHLGMDVLPREYEHFSFFFIKAKVGTDHFWVNRVEHRVEEPHGQTIVWLEGGILNRYREMAVEEALFKRWIGFMDKWHKSSFEIDEILLSHMRK